MIRYAAFLRGVSPSNASMPELARAFEAAGFRDVRTVRASGNVVFSAAAMAVPEVERACEAAISRTLGRTFGTIVRRIDHLRALIDADPYSTFTLPKGSKRVVTFLRARHRGSLSLPMEQDGARILSVVGSEAFSAYVPGPRGPVFMVLIERTFGKEVTTRTWETVQKVADPRLDPIASGGRGRRHGR